MGTCLRAAWKIRGISYEPWPLCLSHKHVPDYYQRVRNSVHFFGDDIGFTPNRTIEELSLFKYRQTNFGEAEGAEDLARGLLDTVPQRGLWRENVAHAFDGLELFGFMLCRGHLEVAGG